MENLDAVLQRVRAEVNGRVIGPDDGNYDRARGIFYGGFDRRPAAVIRVADSDDVARVVTLGDPAARPGRRGGTRAADATVSPIGATR